MVKEQKSLSFVPQNYHDMDFESSVRYANTYNLSRITAMKAIEK